MISKTLLTSLVFLLVGCMHSTTGDGDDDQRPVVQTKFGPVRGSVRQAENGARVNEFLGIPYATPPLGDLRFKRTKEPTNFTGTYEADKMPPPCLQFTEQPLPWFDMDPGQSEDCLYLNIWAPANVGSRLRPVKFFVHGGGWFEGGSNRMGIYDGFGEAIDTKDENGNSKEDGVIVVTINYRLGALGFVTSTLRDYPGNVALKDMALAYQWVSYNIEFFGGDDGHIYDRKSKKLKRRTKYYKMTMVGQGCGAMAISLLQQSLRDTSPFPPFNVVLNGMSFVTLKALEGVDGLGDSSRNNLRLTDILAKRVGCQTSIRDNATATMECLRGVDASRLVRSAASLSRGRGPPNVFIPQLDGPTEHFIYPPFVTLKFGNYSTGKDTFTTFTSEDGSTLLTNAFPEVFGALGEKDVPLSAASAKKVARRVLKKFPQTVADDLLGDMDEDPTTANRDKVVQAFGDAYFNCPNIYYAEFKKNATESIENSKFYILEKMVNSLYNPWGSWMGSVGFDNVQIDFVYPDGLTVNNKTYTYTDEQREQVQVNQNLLKSYMKEEKLPIPEFKREDPAYSVLYSDGKISDEKKTTFYSRNCEILRPYFMFPRETYYPSMYFDL